MNFLAFTLPTLLFVVFSLSNCSAPSESTPLGSRQYVSGSHRIVVPEGIETEEQLFAHFKRLHLQERTQLQESSDNTINRLESESRSLSEAISGSWWYFLGGNGPERERLGTVGRELVAERRRYQEQIRTLGRTQNDSLRRLWSCIEEERKDHLIRRLETTTVCHFNRSHDMGKSSCSLDVNGENYPLPDPLQTREDINEYFNEILYEKEFAIRQQRPNSGEPMLDQMQMDIKIRLLDAEQEFLETRAWECILQRIQWEEKIAAFNGLCKEHNVGQESVEIADENIWLGDSDEPTRLELREYVIDGSPVVMPETEEELYRLVWSIWQQRLCDLDQTHEKGRRILKSNAGLQDLVAEANGYSGFKTGRLTELEWAQFQLQCRVDAQKRALESHFMSLLRKYWISIGEVRKSILIRNLEASTKYRLYPSCSFDFKGRTIVIPEDVRSEDDVRVYSENIYYERKALLQRSLSDEQFLLKQLQKENMLYLLVSEQEFFESVIWNCVRMREERIGRKKDKEIKLEDVEIEEGEETYKIAKVVVESQGLREGKKILESKVVLDVPAELAEGKKSVAKVRRRIVDREKREKTETGKPRETGTDLVAASQGLRGKGKIHEDKSDLESQEETEVTMERTAKIPKSQYLRQPIKKNERKQTAGGRYRLSEDPKFRPNFVPIGKPSLFPESNYDDDDGTILFKKGAACLTNSDDEGPREEYYDCENDWE